MADSIRHQIISTVATGMASILAASGYNTNIGSRVEICRSAIDSKHLPCVVVWPQPETNEKHHGKNKTSMQIRFEGIVACGAEDDAWVIGEQILADIRSRVESLTEDITGGLGDSVLYSSGGVDSYPDPGDTAVNCAAVYQIIYKTTTGNVYSQ